LAIAAYHPKRKPKLRRSRSSRPQMIPIRETGLYVDMAHGAVLATSFMANITPCLRRRAASACGRDERRTSFGATVAGPADHLLVPLQKPVGVGDTAGLFAGKQSRHQKHLRAYVARLRLAAR